MLDKINRLSRQWHHKKFGTWKPKADLRKVFSNVEHDDALNMLHKNMCKRIMTTLVDTIDSLNARLETIETDLKSLSVMNVTLPCDICPCWVSSIEYYDNMRIKNIRTIEYIRPGERNCMCKVQREP